MQWLFDNLWYGWSGHNTECYQIHSPVRRPLLRGVLDQCGGSGVAVLRILRNRNFQSDSECSHKIEMSSEDCSQVGRRQCGGWISPWHGTSSREPSRFLCSAGMTRSSGYFHDPSLNDTEYAATEKFKAISILKELSFLAITIDQPSSLFRSLGNITVHL